MAKTSADIRDEHIRYMGEDLGSVFAALWAEVAEIHARWREWEELFCTKATRVDLMNEAAPQFFAMVQDALLHQLIMNIARLTDRTKSCGKATLTIQCLPGLIADQKTAAEVKKLVEVAEGSVGFCRDWRNRRIAHTELALALDQPAAVLEEATRGKINAALKAIAQVLNAVEGHYMDVNTAFDGFPPDTGALELLHVMDDGLRLRKERKERRARGEYLPTDRRNRDL